MQHQWKQRLQALTAFGAHTELSPPRVELCANKQAVVEGCEGVLAYSETGVRLNCGALVLELEGASLCLNHLSESLVCISGVLTALRFTSV